MGKRNRYYRSMSPLLAATILLSAAGCAFGVHAGYADATRLAIGAPTSVVGLWALATYTRLSPSRKEASVLLEASCYLALATCFVGLLFVLLALGPIRVPAGSASASATYFGVGLFCSALTVLNMVFALGVRRDFVGERVMSLFQWMGGKR